MSHTEQIVATYRNRAGERFELTALREDGPGRFLKGTVVGGGAIAIHASAEVNGELVRIQPAPLVQVCAWCQQERGGTPQPNESHGICRKHMEAELARMRAEREAR